ncbi:unnamed protein product [Adineta ricciae]|uniref:Uncharacterized protein n=1 Tax=Adineta ricciae TaxID=249248 RepID=A0A814WXT3_ADIRI|nr:unnamed protein product [Adineta ricciae]CAF1208259.1 unnamed protein product [Adineta ricciae]
MSRTPANRLGKDNRVRAEAREIASELGYGSGGVGLGYGGPRVRAIFIPCPPQYGMGGQQYLPGGMGGMGNFGGYGGGIPAARNRPFVTANEVVYNQF